jgi:hypothetical protein
MVYSNICIDAVVHNNLECFVAALLETVILQMPMQKEYGSEIRPLASPR